tara:strand:- start:64 stop:894 length:831 start_codon:yes stop_codon:yes gene_type:complete
VSINIKSIRDRIGIDLGSSMPIEDGLIYASEADFRFVDIRIGDVTNKFESFNKSRVSKIRNLLESKDLVVGLHTLSAVNMAEFAPYLSEAVDNYIKSYIDIAKLIDANWVEVHAGFHFTDDYERRKNAGLERLKRMGDYAAKKGVNLLLENMNPEPQDAEVHYLACDVEETKFYFDNLPHENIRWSYTINHAHIIPVGIQGFYKAISPKRLSEVRLADNKGDKEEHLQPGQGNINFNKMFHMIEKDGFKGHYMLAFGSHNDMRVGRDYLIDHLKNI